MELTAITPIIKAIGFFCICAILASIFIIRVKFDVDHSKPQNMGSVWEIWFKGLKYTGYDWIIIIFLKNSFTKANISKYDIIPFNKGGWQYAIRINIGDPLYQEIDGKEMPSIFIFGTRKKKYINKYLILGLSEFPNRFNA